MKGLLTVCFFVSCLAVLKAEDATALLAVGDKAPEFTVLDATGKSITLSAMRGKIILINFWTSACSPCRTNHPAYSQLYHSYKNLGFDIISVSLDVKKDQWMNASRLDRIDWPNNGVDLLGWNSKLVKLYDIKSTPSTFLIDEDGTILYINQDVIALEQTVHYLIFDQPRFYPAVTADKIYFNVLSKYSVVNASGVTVLKGRDKEIAVGGLPYGEYTLLYENKSSRFLKINPILPPVTFYPTRVEDVVTLSKESDYYIYNQRGKLEFKGNGTSIDVSQLPLGVYYLSVNGMVQTFFKK
jgi:peroxiredoxin